MGKILLALIIAGFSYETFAADQSCNRNIILDNAQKILENSNENLETMTPDPGTITGCLDKLKGLDIAIGGLGLSLPSFDDLANMVCEIAVDKVNQGVGKVTGGINDQIDQATGGYGTGVISIGTGSNGPGVNVHDKPETKINPVPNPSSVIGNILGR